MGTVKLWAPMLPLSIVVVSSFALSIRAAELPAEKSPEALPPNRWVIPEPPTWTDVAPDEKSMTRDETIAASLLMAEKMKAWRESLTKEQRAEYWRRKSVMPNADEPWYDWRTTAAQNDLNATQQARLEKTGFVVATRSTRQVFEPYLGDGPFFITSDAVINAYAVLLEDGLIRLEARRAVELRRHLEAIWNALPEWSAQRKLEPAAIANSLTHLRHVIGPALVLLGSEVTRDASAELHAAIDADVANVNAATAQTLPAWLGTPTRQLLAIDFTRMRPIGFYERNTFLASYFRAMRWLQAAPFRVDRDDELFAFVVLSDMVHQRDIDTFFDGYRVFLGSPDSLSFAAAGEGLATILSVRERGRVEILKWAREHARYAASRDGPNERLRDDRDATDDSFVEAMFTIFGTYTTEDVNLLGKIAALPEAASRLPTTLSVARMLGFEEAAGAMKSDGWSSSAIDHAAQHAAARRAAALERKHDEFEEKLFGAGAIAPRFFDALSALAEPVDPAAPPLFASAAWRVKQCNTALGAWAQWRAVWALQEREVLATTGGRNPPPGFIEPVPEFFQRFSFVVSATRAALEQTGALDSATLDSALVYQQMADLIGAMGLDSEPAKTEEAMMDSEFGFRFSALREFAYVLPDRPFEQLHGRMPAPGEWAAFRAHFLSAATDLFAGRNIDELVLPDRYPNHRIDRRRAWTLLAGLLSQLHALSEKQLRGADWSKDEAEFIRHFGETLAHVMLYEADSYMDPRDDAPRIAAVATNPNISRTLHVGVGRPRVIFVLYPWKGTPVLCRGAVVPYYEHASAERLDDAQWKVLLDAEPAPATPEFLAPMYAP